MGGSSAGASDVRSGRIPRSNACSIAESFSAEDWKAFEGNSLREGESLGALYRLNRGEKVEIMGGMLVGRIWLRNTSKQNEVDKFIDIYNDLGVGAIIQEFFPGKCLEGSCLRIVSVFLDVFNVAFEFTFQVIRSQVAFDFFLCCVEMYCKRSSSSGNYERQIGLVGFTRGRRTGLLALPNDSSSHYSYDSCSVDLPSNSSSRSVDIPSNSSSVFRGSSAVPLQISSGVALPISSGVPLPNSSAALRPNYSAALRPNSSAPDASLNAEFRSPSKRPPCFSRLEKEFLTPRTFCVGASWAGIHKFQEEMAMIQTIPNLAPDGRSRTNVGRTQTMWANPYKNTCLPIPSEYNLTLCVHSLTYTTSVEMALKYLLKLGCSEYCHMGLLFDDSAGRSTSTTSTGGSTSTTSKNYWNCGKLYCIYSNYDDFIDAFGKIYKASKTDLKLDGRTVKVVKWTQLLFTVNEEWQLACFRALYGNVAQRFLCNSSSSASASSSSASSASSSSAAASESGDSSPSSNPELGH